MVFSPQMSISMSHSLGEYSPGIELGGKKKKDIFFPLWNTCVDLKLMENGPLVTAFSSLGTLSWTLLGELKEGEHDVMKAIVLSLEKILTNVFFGFLKHSHSFRWRPWLGWGMLWTGNRNPQLGLWSSLMEIMSAGVQTVPREQTWEGKHPGISTSEELLFLRPEKWHHQRLVTSWAVQKVHSVEAGALEENNHCQTYDQEITGEEIT